MKLRKNQSIVLAVTIIVAFFVVGIWFMPSESRHLPSAPSEPAPEVSPVAVATPSPGSDSKFVLKEFHRFEVKDGRKVWEAKGSQGQYSPEDNAARIQDAQVWIYQKDGKQVTMTARQAVLKLQGPGLKGADASGDVTIIYNQNETLKTDLLSYDKEKNKVSAPGLVTISGALLDISGEILDGDLATKSFTLKKNVRTVLKPREKKNDS